MLPAAPCEPPFVVPNARVGHGATPPPGVAETTGKATRLAVATGAGAVAAVAVTDGGTMTVGLAELTAGKAVCEPEEHPARSATQQATPSTGSAGIRLPATRTRCPQ